MEYHTPHKFNVRLHNSFWGAVRPDPSMPPAQGNPAAAAAMRYHASANLRKFHGTSVGCPAPLERGTL